MNGSGHMSGVETCPSILIDWSIDCLELYFTVKVHWISDEIDSSLVVLWFIYTISYK